MINFADFAEFLKNHSTIPNTFIDDFFTFYSYNTTDEDIIIDFSIVAKWLNILKADLKKTLVRSYIKNVDYKISINKSDQNQNQKQKGGRPSETILISTSCFRRICMSSNTDKGKEVRRYYEKIEKLLHKYKNYIIESLQKRVDILLHNQKPIINSEKGVIYFIKSQLETDEVFKLGKTKKFKKRLLSHNSSHSDNVEIALIFETNNMDQVEKCIKVLLKKHQYRKRKEIYQINIDILKEIMEMCDELIDRVDHKIKNKNKVINKLSRQTDKDDFNYFLYFYKSEEK
jgi:phage anti-repressor protein